MSLIKFLPFYQRLYFARKRRQNSRWDEQDQAMLQFYSQFIDSGDSVFDVGANFGNRSKIFLALDSNVIAFEPQARCADFLHSIYKDVPEFTLVRKALAAQSGSGEMFVCDTHTLSTMSQEWISASKNSGRFESYEWGEKQPVQITTLDAAIEQFGLPKFIKIDVEGFEYEVLSGLSRAIESISFEFAAENMANTENCIDHLEALSAGASFQLSLAETMKFELTDWVTAREVKDALSRVSSENKMAWGDIYTRMPPPSA